VTKLDDLRVLGLAAVYQQVVLDEFGEWKNVLRKNPKKVRKSKYYKTFQRLYHILRKNRIKPEIYFRALCKWIKQSKRFPSLWPSMLTGKTMLEIAKSYMRKQYLAHDHDGKAAGKAMKRSRLKEILSEVKQSCEIAERVHKAYSLNVIQICKVLSLSPFFLMTEERYLEDLLRHRRTPTLEERAIAKELMRRDDLFAQVIKIKKGYDYAN